MTITRRSNIFYQAIEAQTRSKYLYMVARDARNAINSVYAIENDRQTYYYDRFLSFSARAAIESKFAQDMRDILTGQWEYPS